jgi:hypothetical protein
MHAMMVLLLLGDGGFFERRDVDFWKSRAKAEAPAEAELWADSPAPGPAKRLLAAPTRENAAAYLDWQARRLVRLREAMEVVEEARRSRGGRAVLYFSRPGCRWCALQEEELAGIPVVRVPERSPLWTEHGVTVTPTLIVNGRALRGFTPRAALLRELGHD